MNRDIELIRKMIVAIEDYPSGFAPDPKELIEMFPGHLPEQIDYHAYLLVDAGFVDGMANDTMGIYTSPRVWLRKMTWRGHEFAANARNETFWRKAWALVQQKGGSVSVQVFSQILTTVAKAELSLPA